MMCSGAGACRIAAWLLEGVFRPDRHDEPEPRPHDVEPEALVLTDLDPLLAFERRRNLGLHDLFDALQMRGKPGLVARRLARLGARLRRQPRIDLSQAGFHFLEYEALLLGLVGSELFRTLAEAAAPQRLQDRGQARDLGLGDGVGLREVLDLRRQASKPATEAPARRLFGLNFRLELSARAKASSASALS